MDPDPLASRQPITVGQPILFLSNETNRIFG
jgi:hypothetical protein